MKFGDWLFLVGDCLAMYVVRVYGGMFVRGGGCAWRWIVLDVLCLCTNILYYYNPNINPKYKNNLKII